MRSLSITKIPLRCMWLAVLVCTVYQSYRYPLQMNSAGTSPTYKDTPAALQAAKYVITAIICLISIMYIPRRLLSYRNWGLACLVFCMSSYAILKAIVAQGGDRASYVDIAFWPILALILAISVRSVSISALDRYLRFVLLYGLASTAIQIVLFLAIGRLPALAYEGSFSVRFGGFLDDPNGFAALIFMLMGWAYFRFTKAKRVAVELSLLICLALTQSLTAFVFLGLLILLFSARQFIRRPPLFIGGCVSLGLILLAALPSLQSNLSAIIADHSGSVEDHLSQVVAAAWKTPFDLLLGGSNYVSMESWWIGSLFNFGILWYLVCILVVITLAWQSIKAYRRAGGTLNKGVSGAVLGLTCYFIFGCINLPLFKIFPINFLYFFLSFLVCFDRIRNDDEDYPCLSYSRSRPLSANV